MGRPIILRADGKTREAAWFGTRRLSFRNISSPGRERRAYGDSTVTAITTGAVPSGPFRNSTLSITSVFWGLIAR